LDSKKKFKDKAPFYVLICLGILFFFVLIYCFIKRKRTKSSDDLKDLRNNASNYSKVHTDDISDSNIASSESENTALASSEGSNIVSYTESNVSGTNLDVMDTNTDVSPSIEVKSLDIETREDDIDPPHDITSTKTYATVHQNKEQKDDEHLDLDLLGLDNTFEITDNEKNVNFDADIINGPSYNLNKDKSSGLNSSSKNDHAFNLFESESAQIGGDSITNISSQSITSKVDAQEIKGIPIQTKDFNEIIIDKTNICEEGNQSNSFSFENKIQIDDQYSTNFQSGIQHSVSNSIDPQILHDDDAISKWNSEKIEEIIDHESVDDIQHSTKNSFIAQNSVDVEKEKKLFKGKIANVIDSENLPKNELIDSEYVLNAENFDEQQPIPKVEMIDAEHVLKPKISRESEGHSP